MAIDTENKRRSCHAYSGCVSLYPVADGTIAAPDRANIAGLYSGITYSVFSAAVRRMWRSVWGRVWKDPGKMDEDT